MSKRVLIVGYGQVGKAINSIENDAGNMCACVDIETDMTQQEFDVMHICFPYENYEQFVIEAEKYINKFKSEIVIIHTTVPPETTKKLSELVKYPIAYSPVIGVHPVLKNSIKTFTKFVGCEDKQTCVDTVIHLKDIGIKATGVGKPVNAELAKILSTTRYGIDIAYATFVKKMCDELNCDFNEVYTKWTNVYNQGYKDMGVNYVQRPVLFPNKGGISGHCVTENLFLLEEYLYHPFIKEILSIGKNIDNWDKPKHHNKHWLGAEYLGKDKTILELSQECGVSTTAIRNALKRFNIKSIYHQPWSEEDDSKLKEYSKEMTFKRIAEMRLIPYRTYEAIRIRASQLKISSEYKPGEQTKNLDVRTKISCTLQGIDKIDFTGFKSTYYSKIRRCDKYNYWRSSVFERDNYTCQRCEKSNVILHAHHIKGFAEIIEEHDINTYEDSLSCDELWDIDNGITYCEKCHMTKIHGKKK